MEVDFFFYVTKNMGSRASRFVRQATLGRVLA